LQIDVQFILIISIDENINICQTKREREIEKKVQKNKGEVRNRHKHEDDARKKNIHPSINEDNRPYTRTKIDRKV
jgi:hypothetical protein